MRKVVSVLLSAAMALSLCAGCSSSSSDTADTKAAEEKGADAADTEAGEAAEGVMPAVAKEDLKVGVIHIGNPADGSGYSYTHDQGIVAMQKAVGLEDDQIIRKNNVADDDQTAIETAMRECVEEGCQIIFATSWGYMDACEALAEEYPDVIFSHATGYKSNGVNFNNYFGRIYQSRYLTGIAAGLKTESNKIGYVGAWGKDNAEVTGGCDAFAMGVYSVNPDATVYIKTTNSWYDPEGEKQAAVALINEGCDVIGQHCDTPNPQLAAVIISQYGGPDGELGASLRYLSQRYSMPYPELKGLLTDIGTEELGHLEMVGTIVHQLTRTLTQEQIESAGFANYFVDHTAGVYPQAASGTPWSAATMAVTGDPIADLTEDLAAEQNARVTYDNILRISDDPDVNDAIRFLREREIVHFQRFGEAIELLRRRLDEKNVYYMNPALNLQA